MDRPDDIITADHQQDLKTILQTYGLNYDDNFLLVDDPHEWALDNEYSGTVEDDCAFYAHRDNKIIFKKRISQSKKKNVLDGIDMRITFVTPPVRTSSPSSTVLNSDKKFLKHTLLHEIGHYSGKSNETEADIFAFSKIGYTVVRFNINNI